MYIVATELCSTFVTTFSLPIHFISTSTTQMCHRRIFAVHECVPLQVHIAYVSVVLLNMAVLERIQGEYEYSSTRLRRVPILVLVLEYSFETSTRTRTRTQVLVLVLVLRYSYSYSGTRTRTRTQVLVSQMGTHMDEYELSTSFHFGISHEYSYS